jgi:hypothetical protein
MVKRPRGLHRYAGSLPAAGAQVFRIPRIPVEAYRRRLTGLPLTGGQAQGKISGTGTLTLSVGPQGLGNIWYPVQVTLSTTIGAFDTSTALVYLGAQGVPVTLVGSLYTGNGTVALAIPPMTPGQVLIVSWSGATSGDTAAMNILGTMDALSA